jgi:low affinity Fe/Cu permease
MQNPFESGHIKNYILLYASVVVIMILFFIATTLLRDDKDIDKKIFSTQASKSVQESIKAEEKEEEPSLTSKIKLMDRSY